MLVKCKSYIVYYTVIHIRVQYMSVTYCGSNYEVNSSLIHVYDILHFARDQQSSHTTVSYFLMFGWSRDVYIWYPRGDTTCGVSQLVIVTGERAIGYFDNRRWSCGERMWDGG
jgi:hypothetical protein